MGLACVRQVGRITRGGSRNEIRGLSLRYPILNGQHSIDAFRRRTRDFDCKWMLLTQRKEGGERLRQTFGHLEAISSRASFTETKYFMIWMRLCKTERGGWDASDRSVLANG
jgi:hypothetical protein